MGTVISIVVGIVALFIGLQLVMVLKTKFKKGKPAPSLEGKAGRMINAGEKVLFYFYSPGCRACKPMTPFIKNMARKNKKIFPIDISHDMTMARKFGVMGTPSTVVVESGKIVEFLVGFQPENRVRSLVA